MNPVDHPHGGGEGKNHSLRPPVRHSLGQADEGLSSTRDPKKASNRLIIRRRKSK